MSGVRLPPFEEPVAAFILKRVFGHARFRGLQESSVRSVLGGRDCLVLMATGQGKSLLYQFVSVYAKEFDAVKAQLAGGAGAGFARDPRARPGSTIVVSPLLSLMEDQTQALRQTSVRACALNGEQKDMGVWEGAKGK
jgi:ATP-dependent DNA helicase RecQ